MKKLILALVLAFASSQAFTEGVVYQEGVDTTLNTSCEPPTTRTDGTPITLEEMDTTKIFLSQDRSFNTIAHTVIVGNIYCNQAFALANLNGYGQWYKTAAIRDTDGLWSEAQPIDVAFEWLAEVIPPPITPDNPIDRSMWTVVASSEETVNWFMPAEYSFDGDNNTEWHSQYEGSVGFEEPMPHTLDYNLAGIYKLAAVQFLTRDIDQNASIKDYEIYSSMNGNSWTLAATGTVVGNGLQTIEFTPANAKHLRIKILSEQDGGQQASIKELYGFGELVVLKPPKPPKNIK